MKTELLLLVIYASLISYIWTGVVAASHIFKPFRELFRSVIGYWLPWYFAKKFVKYWLEEEDKWKRIITTDDEDTTFDGRNVAGYDMITCRLCAGFYVSCIVAYAFNIPWTHWFAVYGLSYFMSTQER